MLKCLQILKLLWFGAILISRKKMKQNVEIVLNDYHGSSTVVLKRHLKKVHNIIFQKECEDEPLNKKLCIQSNLDSMIKNISLDERKVGLFCSC